MELTEGQIIEKYAKQCKHCLRKLFYQMNVNLSMLLVDIT